MKICFTYKPISGSYGGGNFFVQNMVKYLAQKDIQCVYKLEDDINIIFVIDPRGSDRKISLNEVIKFKNKHPNIKIIHRVNECDIKRQKSINIEKLLLEVFKIADYIVFVSEWLMNYYVNKYDILKDKLYTYVLNGVDTKVFYKIDNHKIDHNNIKIVTHHWSNNYMKGFYIYNKLDSILKDYPNITFTFIGNYNKEYKPTNIKMIKCLHGEKLANELRKHDIYLTATQNEPGAMHYLEGASCGLPVLYRTNGGGAKEICSKFGEEYDTIDEMFSQLDNIINNYKDYENRINTSYLDYNRCCKEYYDIIKSF